MSKPDEKAPSLQGQGQGLGDLNLVASKREFIETFFKRGAELTEQLMRENERLRYRVVELEEVERARKVDERPGSSHATVRELAARVTALEDEREQLLSRFRGVESESENFASRFHDIERENNNLANLYVASFQLHSILDLGEVTQIILEIMLNFVGAKTFAIQLVAEDGRGLRTLAAEGIERERVPAGKLGEGRIGQALAKGEPYVDESRLGARADLEHPLIVVPLKIRERVVGAVVVWDLLTQKTALAEVDYELFNLLGAHAASALQAAKLMTELEGRSPALWAAADLV